MAQKHLLEQLSLEDFAAVREAPPTHVVNDQQAARINPQTDLTIDPKKEAPGKMKNEAPVESENEIQVLSVSSLNRAIRGQLEGKFNLVWVRGEISNFKPHTSGHFYFSLKDESSQINAVMFRGFNQKLKFQPENGMEVLVRGKITVYEPRGNYQVFCEIMEPVGVGALQLAYEQLKANLQKEGLFDSSRKKSLPFLPKRIGIITSPTGAAIRDILNILTRRAKGVEITIFPALVQGSGAAQDLLRALSLAEKVGEIDVLIIGRGGGSIEDLWAFNDESLARAIASCPFPTVSAVGHEVDYTISDFVADLRAPTPSAAAELVVKNKAELIEKLGSLANQLRIHMLRKIQIRIREVKILERGLIDPKKRLTDLAQKCDDLLGRLQLSAQNKLRMMRLEIGKLAAILETLSPLAVVARGYSIVEGEGKIIRDVEMLREGGRISIRFSRGRAHARIESIEKET